MKKRILTFLLLFSMIVATVAPSTAYAATKKEKKTNETTQKQEHGTTPFSKITYKRPDSKVIDKKLDKILALIKKDNQSNKIDKLYTEVNDLTNEFLTMVRYLNVMYSKDVTNTELLAEFNDLSTEYLTLAEKECEVIIAILESKYGDELKKELTEDEIKEIYKNKEILSDEYIKLQTEASNLNSEYQIALNTTTIDVNGTAMTLNDIVSSPDLSREEMIKYYTQLMNQLNQKAGEIYLKIVANYKEQAKLAGYDSVADYMYDQYNRDFTKEQSRQFAQYVKQEIVPLYSSISSSLSAEDIAKVDSAAGDIDQFVPSFKKYFKSINSEMLKAYNYMSKYELCDYNATPVKQQANYTIMLPSFNEPYISLYPYGSYYDISSFVHEFGHFYAYYTHGNNLKTNLDILEIHSLANELLFMPNYKVYGDAYEPIVKYQLIIMLYANVIQGSLYDEFQQQVFEKNITSVEELNQLFFKLECQYGLADSSTGMTEDGSWIFVPHTFQAPFYYISYAIAAVPALEIYATSLTDRDAAIKAYNKIIKYGTDYDYTSLLIRSRLASPFSEYTLDFISDSLYDAFGLTNPDYVTEDPAA